jgi:diadenosine tetraphosphate (Ap4A) HIT family hydrolase
MPAGVLYPLHPNADMRIKSFMPALVVFAAGIVCGGMLFSKSAPRSFLAFADCQERCFRASELAGLVASSAIQRVPAAIPKVVMESDTCLSVRHPRPQGRVHYVLFPKHDTRNITTLTPEDVPYVLGCFAMARELVARDKLQAYRMHTNGPDFQEVAYLHFHLVAD